MKSLDKNSRIPLYYQLADVLIEEIEAGRLIENDTLPSEREFCEEYEISRATVRQAMLELEKGGYIYKAHGKGTFVSPKKLDQELLKFYSFTEDMKKLGKKPSTKVISFEIMNCREEIAKKMRINVNDMVYKIIRLRLANGEPMMLQNSYIPYNRFPGITREDLESESMYEIFKKRFNASLTSGEEIFQVVNIREKEAEQLKISKDSPSMMIERFTFENDTIIEYTAAVARGDRFKYHVVLNK